MPYNFGIQVYDSFISTIVGFSVKVHPLKICLSIQIILCPIYYSKPILYVVMVTILLYFLWRIQEFNKSIMLIYTWCCCRYSKLAVKLERSIMANPVVKRLKNMVEELSSTVPVLQNMRNQALKERHWKKIEIVISRRVYTLDICYLI